MALARLLRWALLFLVAGCSPTPTADESQYAETIALFRGAGQSAKFFDTSYGYAVFPAIGKGGLIVGGAHGSGRVYEKGRHVGDAVMNQVTVGAQLGGQAYREIIFFQDKRAFDEFTSGQFELGAQATAVAITAGASAQASTGGSSAGASSAPAAGHASTRGGYQNGMAVFTVARGGLMYEASVGGQKFGYVKK
jgi:lipid-binding SYLF domain-containing protein